MAHIAYGRDEWSAKRAAAFIVAKLSVFHLLFTYLGAYQVPHMDSIMHFMGGYAMCFIGRLFTTRFWALCFGLAVGVGWEVLEYAAGDFLPFMAVPTDPVDTVQDLLAVGIGALIVLVLPRRITISLEASEEY